MDIVEDFYFSLQLNKINIQLKSKILTKRTQRFIHLITSNQLFDKIKELKYVYTK